jgi:hypothetical protein
MCLKPKIPFSQRYPNVVDEAMYVLLEFFRGRVPQSLAAFSQIILIILWSTPHWIT